MLDETGAAIYLIPVDSLLPADSPRLAGLSADHVRVLAESGTELDPVLVDQDSGRVVDGMHRWQAAIARGDRNIVVRYIEGSADDLFIRSVEANNRHGLPLTLKDRKAAVARILASHPHWSDRAIAAVVGLSPKTVGSARRRLSTEESPHSNNAARIGRDGRARPADIPRRREKALVLLAEQPSATLREIAEGAGLSISTVHRMRQGAGTPDSVRLPEGQPPAAAPSSERPEAPDRMLRAAVATPQESRLVAVSQLPSDPDAALAARSRAMRVLANDPSLRFTDSGRALLRWLNGQAQELAAGERILAEIPPHCVHAVAEVTGQFAKQWEQLSESLQEFDRQNESVTAQ
ncbi:ParB/RepB/Spo0J family partition protein [Streptomyces fildesensis]|uniref:ParB/RepB/Spo0J family partition protein n=1 Tax=Streptomyces fildesensis TaxID=375757 RepID=UPI0018DF9B75|nr:helix-turn-helix domain-containing protein [Streptomyces fildesensis]